MMVPILVKIGPLTIHTYGFMLAIGVLFGIILSLKLAKKQNIETRIFADLIFYTILIGLVGGKIFLIISNIGTYINDPSRLKYVLRASGTFYGGLIAGTIFAVWYIKKRKLNLMTVADIFGPSIALAHFFVGQVGCGIILVQCGPRVYKRKLDSVSKLADGDGAVDDDGVRARADDNRVELGGCGGRGIGVLIRCEKGL